MVGCILLALVSLAFLIWHEPWFSRRLKPGEAIAAIGGDYAEMDPEERRAFEAFMDGDDGRPFYMLNLMRYRGQAEYRDGKLPDGGVAAGLTGREAGRLYERMVVPELLKRGCYPVFVSRKIGNLLSAGSGSDFFEEIAVVRYRSRRDMLSMVASRPFVEGIPHKWASLEKTVAVPTRLMLLVDLRTLVPLTLFAAYAIAGWF
jgi:hypothetical protein